MPETPQIVIVGLGYVGLPLAIALARHFPVCGLDVDAERIAELTGRHHDRTGEIDDARLAATTMSFTCNPADCPPADIYIVTVPTPVDTANKPDLSIVVRASETVGAMLPADRQPIIVYESTVYPGVTEEVCAPVLERVSGRTCGRDFFLGYSPERINPGDREHTVDRIMKVVAGQTPAVTDTLCAVYGAMTSGGTYRAASIKAAEAAKVIENAQRDINIAFMNEVAQIFGAMDLSVWDVLDAARTKWNFLPFSPGLVGGHCIGVDPYYLSHRAEQLGHDPRVILAGRSINDGMAAWVADRLHAAVGPEPKSVLMLGLTFKEDVPDLRNSKVADLIAALAAHGHSVAVHDPLADAAEAAHEYGLNLQTGDLPGQHDLVVLAVPHRAYLSLGADALSALVAPGGLFADLKNGLGAMRDNMSVALWRL